MLKKSVNHSKDKDTNLKQEDKANVEVIRNLKVAEIKEALNRLEDAEKKVKDLQYWLFSNELNN
jgi:DNA-directed RNA polymerase specialized sigma subunit